MKTQLILNPRALKKPFIAVGVALILASGLSVGLSLSKTLTGFFLLSAFLVLSDWYLFHRNNLKEYWRELLAHRGVAPSYDRQWNSWTLGERLMHIAMFMIIAASVVGGLESPLLFVIFGLIVPPLIWWYLNEATLPKRTSEPIRQD